MPHLLKSNELSSSTPPSIPPTDAQVLEFRRPGGKQHTRSTTSPPEAGQDLGPLRMQVIEIIDTILAETGPDEAEVRENLRRHVASHPGRPEKALLKHLLNVSS